MKKTINLFKFFLIVAGFFVMVLLPTVKVISLNLSASVGARDPHAHMGSNTLCYNIETWACDTGGIKR